MESHRTCSFAGSLAAVSWRRTESVAPDVTASVVVVADPFMGPGASRIDGGRVVATITLRLTVRRARVHVSVDGRHVASIDLHCSVPEGVPRRGHLFRDEAVLPLDVLDGRTHLLEVAVDAAGVVDRISLAKHETAFYARRVSTRESRRALAVAGQ